MAARQSFGNPLGVKSHDGDRLATRRRGPTSDDDSEVNDALEGIGERRCEEYLASIGIEKAGELISSP